MTKYQSKSCQIRPIKSTYRRPSNLICLVAWNWRIPSSNIASKPNVSHFFLTAWHIIILPFYLLHDNQNNAACLISSTLRQLHQMHKFLESDTVHILCEQFSHFLLRFNGMQSDCLLPNVNDQNLILKIDKSWHIRNDVIGRVLYGSDIIFSKRDCKHLFNIRSWERLAQILRNVSDL